MSTENGRTTERKPKFDVEQLFSYQNPNFGDYQKLFERLQLDNSFADLRGASPAAFWVNVFGIEQEDEYMGFWPEDRKKVKAYLQQKLKDAVLLDLGCGTIESTVSNVGAGSMLETFKKFCVSHHVGVDLFSGYYEQPKPLSLNGTVYSIKDDMLLRAAKIPSSQVNVTINGIDDIIIPSPEYHMALAIELARICRVDGIIFGVNSEVLRLLERKIKGGEITNFKIPALDTNKPISGIDNRFVFEKIAE